MKILVINLGATSSKIAIYEDEKEIFLRSIPHSNELLKQYTHNPEQLGFRKQAILDTLSEAGYAPGDFAAVISRGGPMKPVAGGTYLIDDEVLKDAANPMVGGRHPAPIGIMIAAELQKEYGIPAYFADPVSVDELCDEARLTGLKGMTRGSMFHALNQKAVARRAAKQLGKTYEEANLIGVHVGGGTSVAAHCRGRVIDTFDIQNDGCMGMDRPGNLPALQVIDLCFSGQYKKEELQKLLHKSAGVYSYLGIKDFRTMLQMIDDGNQEAEAVYKAMIFEIAKDVGAMAAVLKFDVDAVFLTGGIAFSRRFCDDLEAYIQKLAPVLECPGEDEMEALAGNALRILQGEKAKEYGSALEG